MRDRSDLTINEAVAKAPIGYAPISVKYEGNVDLAKSHLAWGRKQLAQMKTMYGLNERKAAGEEGGYYQRRVKLADGTVVTTQYNEQFQQIHIDAPHPPEEKEERKVESDVINPYLWIGTRPLLEGLSEPVVTTNGVATHMTVVEEPGLRGILVDGGNYGQWWEGNFYWYNVFPDPEMYNQIPSWDGPITIGYFDPAQQAFYWNEWYNLYGGGYCFPPGLIEEGGWNLENSMFMIQEYAADRSGEAEVGFTSHGMRVNDMRLSVDHRLWTMKYALTAHDPEWPEFTAEKPNPWPAEVYQTGTYRGPAIEPWLEPAPWYSTFVVDPSEGDSFIPDAQGNLTRPNEPTSLRAGDLAIHNLIRDTFNLSREDEALEGKYAIKLAGYGEDCVCGDYVGPPQKVEIEVRSAKAPHTRVYRTIIDINEYSYYFLQTQPFGKMSYYDCAATSELGPGTMCTNWWRGAIFADLYGGIEEVDEYQPRYLPGGGPCRQPCTQPDMVPWAVGFYKGYSGNWCAAAFGEDVTPAECLAYSIRGAIDYWLDRGAGPGTCPNVADASIAALIAGIEPWVDADGAFAMLYDYRAGTFVVPPSGCSNTVWKSQSDAQWGDGCWEAMLAAYGVDEDQSFVYAPGGMRIVPWFYDQSMCEGWVLGEPCP